MTPSFWRSWQDRNDSIWAIWNKFKSHDEKSGLKWAMMIPMSFEEFPKFSTASGGVPFLLTTSSPFEFHYCSLLYINNITISGCSLLDVGWWQWCWWLWLQGSFAHNYTKMHTRKDCHYHSHLLKPSPHQASFGLWFCLAVQLYFQWGSISCYPNKLQKLEDALVKK